MMTRTSAVIPMSPRDRSLPWSRGAGGHRPAGCGLRQRVRVWHAGLTPASAAMIVGAVVTAFVLRNMFVEAHRIVGWVVACCDRRPPDRAARGHRRPGAAPLDQRDRRVARRRRDHRGESRSASPTICSTPSTNCRRRRPRPPPGLEEQFRLGRGHRRRRPGSRRSSTSWATGSTSAPCPGSPGPRRRTSSPAS